ncbi:MAG: MliC family protein [Candidatus Pacebacteria bacterium]|nr:MliC family protein [Candidatus Paceibacterota bacterium]
MIIEWKRVTWYSQIIAIVLFVDVFVMGIWLGMEIDQTRFMSAREMTQAQQTSAKPVTQQAPAGSVISSVSYSCDAGKKAQAIYTQNTVNLNLSDGRSMNLLQSISADGGRYTNSDESFVFWSKGSSAFITEGSKTTFNNCTEDKTQAQ